jgi:addiction module RelE/StbE family toxin
MKPVLQKSFTKNYAKLPKAIKKKFAEKVDLLIAEPNNPLLRRHYLKGSLLPLQSINITGDYRALFTIDRNKQLIIFYKIGTHSELY